MQRRIPYSVVNFERLRQGMYYYVDKTGYIRQLEKYACPVFLRPRRFGKSLWCSILECYYDISRKGVFERLFGGTEIGARPTPSHNSCLVLKLNFSTVKPGIGISDLEDSFNRTVSNAADEFIRHYEGYFGAGDELRAQPNATEFLKKLVSQVKSEGLPRLYVIIDEYDNFTNQLLASMRDADYRTLTTADSFLRTFFKTLKAGTEDGAIRTVFMTGVLPVTLDDLTSGFNIGQNLSLRPEMLSMIGFTRTEVERYVDDVLFDYGFDLSLRPRILSDMRAYYDGYRFSGEADEPLYNPTICSSYLSELIDNGGRLPRRTIDTNVKPDIAWLTVMARRGTAVENLLQSLVGRNEPVPISPEKVNEQISAGKFFSAEYFPLCLYYLGLLTFKDEFSLGVPNLSVERVVLDYYQEVHVRKDPVLSDPKVVEALRAFVANRRWKDLFGTFWEYGIRRIMPAKLFSYVNEFFFQVMFFGFCIDRLSSRYSIRIEENHFSGQSDFLAVPVPGEDAPIVVLEFKYISKGAAKKAVVPAGDSAQVVHAKDQLSRYMQDVRLQHPGKSVEGAVVLVTGNSGFEFFDVL